MFNLNNTFHDVSFKNKRVLIRLDLNVPIYKNNITSDTRIISSLPTIIKSLEKKAKVVIIMSHLGRPTEGLFEKKFSLLPVFNYLKSKIPNQEILFYQNDIEQLNFKNIKEKIILLENVRFNIGETSNSDILSKKYASICDIFVMDAFASAHRKHSSTYGICKFVNNVCMGPLLLSELNYLYKALKNPKRPMLSIVGGSKVSTKFNVLNNLLKISDYVVVGGGIANTFAALNNKIGKSLYDKESLEQASLLFNKPNIIIPKDFIVGNTFSEKSDAIYRKINNIHDHDMIMDIGKNTLHEILGLIKKSKTILWNGPLGVYEFFKFRQGTTYIANAIANNKVFSIAGGGDTLAIIESLNLKNKFSYISTGGGAFLDIVGGKKLPSIKIIEKITEKNKIR